jgi:hypothetical protein
MSQPLKDFTSLSRAEVARQIDRELAVSYLELQELRRKVRIAQCGRAIPNPAANDLPPKKRKQ